MVKNITIGNVMPLAIPDTTTPDPLRYSKRDGNETSKKWIKIGLVIFFIGIISGIITYLIGMIYFSIPLMLPYTPFLCFIGFLFIIGGLGRRHYFS